MTHFGVCWPEETVQKIDRVKGRYLSRTKYILKVLEEHLNDIENNKENGLQGASGLGKHQAAAAHEEVNSGGAQTDSRST
jgi:hypothetical protein